jgi:hypothetical protein
MQISRRATLAYASALTAVSATFTGAFANVLVRASSGRFQRVQHLVVHPDEADGGTVCAILAIEAPDTAWKTSGMLDESALHSTTAALRLRGYGLRRANAFQTRQGVRYAALWQLGGAVPARAETGMDLATFRATAAGYAEQGLAISQIDAAHTEAGARFSALWDSAPQDRQTMVADLTAAGYADHTAARAADGQVPRLIAGYATGGDVRFAAVFGAARAAALQTDLALPASEYHARSRAMNAAGFELRDASGYVAGGQPFLTAVWEKA